MKHIKIAASYFLLLCSITTFAQQNGKSYQFGEPEPIGINTEAYDELLPVLSPDGKTLFFAKRNHPKNATGVNDLIDVWYAEKGANGWSKATPKKSWFNNYGYNFVSSISGDGNILILGNTYLPSGNMEAGPSFSTWNGAEWAFPEKMNIKDFKNNSNAYNFNLSKDGKILLLSLNNEQSSGNRDLFVSFKEGPNSWSAPKNLGKQVNTSQQDVTPYLAKDNKTLFFSSNGHDGEGDLDVFVTQRLDESWTNWSTPKNLGNTINTNQSEAYFILDNEEKRAYYTQGESNGNADILTTNVTRVDAKEVKEEKKVIVNPLVKAAPAIVSEQPKLKPQAEVVVKNEVQNTIVSGIVTDKKTGEPIQGNVYYKADGINNKVATDENGKYSVALLSGKTYTLTPRAYDHVSNNFKLEVPKSYTAEQITMNMALEPVEHGKVINLDKIYFDTGKSSIRSESYPELNNAYNVLSNYEGIAIEVSGHTDNTGSVAYNKDLSKRRAQAVVNYLVKKGFDGNKAVAVGYGPEKPIADNSTNEGRQKNRRVEILIK